jgi:hypothetical protein
MDFEEAAKAYGLNAVKDENLVTVSRLVERQLMLQRNVEEAELALEVAKRELREVQEKMLPEALTEFGLSEVVMKDGSKVVVKEDVKTSISKDRENEAFTWLRDHGFDSIIKNVVSVPFGRGEDEKAAQLVRSLDEGGFAPNHSMKVEAMTLKAFVREQLRNGTPVPEDVFGVFIVNKATIVPPKAKRI